MSEILPEWVSQLIDSEWLWIIEVFVLVLLTTIAALLVKHLLIKLLQQAKQSQTLWDDALIEAAAKPLHWMIWLLGLSLSAQIAAAQSEINLLKSAVPVRQVGVILLLTWFVVRFIHRVEPRYIDPAFSKKPMDTTTVMAVGKLLRISVLITSSLVILQKLGYSISGILAFGGVGGLAVGLAAKDLLANFFGGLMIYLDRPFKVGDWVRSPDREIEGTIEDIGWRLSRIRTFDQRPLYVPNAVFNQIAVENPSRMLNRRIYETIGIRYSDANKMATIVADVRQMLEQHEDIDKNKTLIVNFNSFAPSSLDFFIYTFTKTTDWVQYHQVKEKVLLKVLEIIAHHGAETAFPTSTVHIADAVELANRTDHDI